MYHCWYCFKNVTRKQGYLMNKWLNLFTKHLQKQTCSFIGLPQELLISFFKQDITSNLISTEYKALFNALTASHAMSSTTAPYETNEDLRLFNLTISDLMKQYDIKCIDTLINRFDLKLVTSNQLLDATNTPYHAVILDATCDFVKNYYLQLLDSSSNNVHLAIANQVVQCLCLVNDRGELQLALPVYRVQTSDCLTVSTDLQTIDKILNLMPLTKYHNHFYVRYIQKNLEVPFTEHGCKKQLSFQVIANRFNQNNTSFATKNTMKEVIATLNEINLDVGDNYLSNHLQLAINKQGYLQFVSPDLKLDPQVEAKLAAVKRRNINQNFDDIEVFDDSSIVPLYNSYQKDTFFSTYLFRIDNSSIFKSLPVNFKHTKSVDIPLHQPTNMVQLATTDQLHQTLMAIQPNNNHCYYATDNYLYDLQGNNHINQIDKMDLTQ